MTSIPKTFFRLAMDAGFSELSIQAEHTFAVARMPWLHRDPFDRLLVAQAQSLPAYLLTTDSLLKPYSDLVLHLDLVSL